MGDSPRKWIETHFPKNTCEGGWDHYLSRSQRCQVMWGAKTFKASVSFGIQKHAVPDLFLAAPSVPEKARTQKKVGQTHSDAPSHGPIIQGSECDKNVPGDTQNILNHLNRTLIAASEDENLRSVLTPKLHPSAFLSLPCVTGGPKMPKIICRKVGALPPTIQHLKGGYGTVHSTPKTAVSAWCILFFHRRPL